MVIPSSVVMTCMRIGETKLCSKAAAALSILTPHTPDTAIAAAAFKAMCAPGTDIAHDTLPHGVAALTDARAISSSSHFVIRISALSCTPYVSTCAWVNVRISRTRSSSAFKIAKPDCGSACTSSAFARATPSMPPTRSVWAAATAVTTPIAGRPIEHSRAISPKPRIPISNTTACELSAAFNNVTGKP